MASTFAEAVTASFYAWEIRGRGWMLSDYPVVLEPPFRGCVLLPGFTASPHVIVDDGKRPTLLSSLVAGVKDAILARQVEPQRSEPFEEPEPASAVTGDTLTALRVTVPADYRSRPEVMLQLFRSLSTTLGPIAFEIVGSGAEVQIQITVNDVDAHMVRAHVGASIPEAVIIEDDDLLARVWDESSAQIVVDFGLSAEFFLPLGTHTKGLDSYVALIPVLSSADRGELVAVQVLFEAVRNPWASAIRDALDDGQGGSIMEDAPEFIPLSR
ncbi:MAG: hypothetical protein IH628_03430, partial [Proteobacteria bacterium]|nr:hypothetical protein [Pseudomonadota bacterium]